MVAASRKTFPTRMLLIALLAASALCAACIAADAPHAPRLAAKDGRVAGGYRLSAGGEPSFRLFTAKANGDDLRQLGEFHGRLAGVAMDDGGAVLALTADGALGRYGDDVETLAEPDSRWNMAALFWHNGEALAITNDNGALHAVRAGADGEWRRDERPLARVGAGAPALVDGAAFADGLHILVASFAEDLSRGAVRHLVLDGETNRWRELPALPAGTVDMLAAVPAPAPRGFRAEPAFSPGAVTLRRDPVLPERTSLSFHAWRGGRWTRAALPAGLAENAPAGTPGFAAAADAGGGAPSWLLTGRDGAFLVCPPSGGSAGAVIRAGGGAGAAAGGGFERWSGFLTFLAFAALVLLYCRRSRALSRALPGRPADLFSRAAALAVDSLLVSLVMGGYHVANGDVHILDRLMNLEDVQVIFWANLGAFILYTALFESFFGRTPGKHLAGLRVRSVLGGQASKGQAVLRNLVRAVDMFPLPVAFPGLIGLLSALWGPRRQRVGDRVAGTIVLRHCPLPRREFFLASASPRRMELMGATGLRVRSGAMDVNEAILEREEPQDAVNRLSQEKARAAGEHVRPGEIIIAADTVVVLDGRILGKPADQDEARSMLASLSGKSHSVFTGVTVWDTATGQGVTECEETEVEFRVLSDAEIERYVQSGEPMDKAGAYGAQSGGHLIKQIRGSLSNVVGLPMEKLRMMLGALDA